MEKLLIFFLFCYNQYLLKNTDIKSTKNMKQSVKIVSYIYDNYVQ